LEKIALFSSQKAPGSGADGLRQGHPVRRSSVSSCKPAEIQISLRVQQSSLDGFHRTLHHGGHLIAGEPKSIYKFRDGTYCLNDSRMKACETLSGLEVTSEESPRSQLEQTHPNLLTRS